MPFGTSDGRTFDDEFSHAMGQLDAMHNETFGTGEDKPSISQYMYPTPDEDLPKPLETNQRSNEGILKRRGIDLDTVRPGEVYDDSQTDQEYDRRLIQWSKDYRGATGRRFDNPSFDDRMPELGTNLPQATELGKRGWAYNDGTLPPVIRQDISMKQDASQVSERMKTDQVVEKLTNNFDTYKTFGRILNRVGTGLASLATLPGKVYNGEIDPNTPEGQKKVEQWARDMAMTMVMTPAPLVMKSVDGTLGSIAGIRAKTADKDLLDAAVSMDKKGYTNNEIWQNSGWFKGSDGNWRHEIPNSDKATFVEPPKVSDPHKLSATDMAEGIINHKLVTLGEIFKYPELYKAYPELKNMGVTFKEVEGEFGHYSQDQGSINLSLDRIKKAGTDPIDTIIHEVQHAIQAKEGYVYGTAPNKVGELIGEEVQKALKARDIPRVNELYAIADKYLKPKSPELQAIKDELYSRSPGEREANLVEMRRNMTQAEREGYSPSYYQRVADDMYGTSEYRSKVFPEEILK